MIGQINRKIKVYNRVAIFYDILDLPFEHSRYKSLRKIVFDGLSGSLLDAGVGTGRNFPFYPKDSKVTGIDLSPAMLHRARIRQRKLRISVTLKEMNVTALNFPDNTFDNVVATFLFCVLEESQQVFALNELRRVCQARGIIRILEYSISQNPIRRFIMKLWEPWVKHIYGAAFDQRTEQYAETAGLELIEERWLYKDIIKMISLSPKSL
ncbi:MAG: Ubiquinone/menaquinone biosynthesis C-methyltransferase UbiE [Alphaproteobacteria bacterium MarineAlpha3_Bin5]|nr:methyltransferase type 11 [Magnetovibrio sp.]PPR78808.1 MAG: Ubiquinone/menaquinone biosynthesis C-methyltransferase UbiE [Alphaproteobacteria bacterium MarineAlpha3_Bin5]